MDVTMYHNNENLKNYVPTSKGKRDPEKSYAVDIYFDNAFPRLYEHVEGGVCEKFDFTCEYGEVYHIYVKREIPKKVKNVQYSDAITPYGYGGPIITSLIKIPGLSKVQIKQMLVAAFNVAFSKYCLENHIVSEFVRFHPLFDNAADFSSIYKVEHIRNTVGTNLEKYPDFFYQEYSKSCRKNINKALNKGVTVEVIEAPESLDEFNAVYYSTMDRNNAAGYYYFQDDYFHKCLDYYKEHILLVKALYDGKVIAAGFYFTWNGIVHIHLSGTLSEYLHLSPAYMLRYGVTKWALEHGYRLIHHGGGRTNDSEDSLYKFKKQFGKHTDFPFYVGKKIWDEKVYVKLCTVTGAYDDSFFPAYRTR